MSQHFTHLHLHTEFSLLDGAITLDQLVQFGITHKMKALAITDHGNVFGAVKFFEKAKKAGIKPILGIEAYLAEDATVRSIEKKYYHLVLLVQNETGYKNLCKLISYSFQQGFYFKPRIDYAMLEKHAEGLIALSACLGGHIPKLLMNGEFELAENRMDWFLRVFGRDRFYLEVQPEDQEEQKKLNALLYHWSALKNIELVATGDCHYPSLADHEAHETMLCIQTHNKIDDPGRYTFGDCRVWMRTQDEMLELFKDHPQAIWNTGKIADMCDFKFQTDKLFFPKFEIPAEHTQESFFKHLCQKGLNNLIANGFITAEQQEIYQARLDLEVDLITKMGFIGYFLVVSDFIQWAKTQRIPVGPGRGSAAGSLVAWAIQITNIDPIKYNLLFERFLNPERVTMPDIDIDFCIEGRERVIDYVRDKYGHDKVCQIITFGTMAAKGVIKDVARALGFPFEDSNAITSLIPDQLKITLTEALEQEPRLKDLIEGNPKAKKLFDIAFKLEGLTRHASKHAAGVVISPEPIDEVLPVYVPPKTTELVTQYAMTELESIGFLKIDFLGLKNLTLIDRVVKLIQQNRGISIDIDKLPLDDAKTFELICAGKTSGVFQLESDGLKEVLRKLQPDKFEDIIAVNALYRPGPLGSGMVDDFVERRHGRQKISYQFNELQPILEETYGVIVYQEQVMKIASAIGGYSLGEADILRRAMGKKKADVMAEQRSIFLEKSIARGFDGKKAGELFDLVAYFAGYGFNKSHSAAYALIAYQTAYLKANYLPEFLACLISLEATHPEKMTFYLQEAKDMGIKILPADINKSAIDFSVVDGNILFGLQGIKNVGLAALDNIIKEREKKQFADLLDFCKRIDLRTANKRVLENLVYAGACDQLPGNRAQKINELQRIMDLAAEHKKEKATGQMGLFGALPNATKEQSDLYAFQPHPDLNDKEKLEKEKEVVGFYLSAHPLETYDQQLRWLNLPSFAHILEEGLKTTGTQEPIVVGCGILKSKRAITTKKGDPMAFLQLEDMSSHAEIIVFPKVYKQIESLLGEYTAFIVKGALDLTAAQKCKIKANEVVPIELLFDKLSCHTITLKLPQTFDAQLIKTVHEKLIKGPTSLAFMFTENGKELCLQTKQKVLIDAELLQAVEQLSIKVQVTI